MWYNIKTEKGELGMSKIQMNEQYEVISQQEVDKKLALIAKKLEITVAEMNEKKVNDEVMPLLIEFISGELFLTTIQQLEDQIAKTLNYLKNDEFLVAVVDVVEADLNRFREELALNVTMLHFSSIGTCEVTAKNRKVSVREFSENAIRSYANYIFEIINEIVNINEMLSNNNPKDFHPSFHRPNRKRKSIG